MNRRDTLKLLAAASVGAAIPGCTDEAVDRAAERVAAIGSAELANRTPVILSQHEYATVEVLVDLIIPADDRSGSATDAGVPAFIDFILEDVEGLDVPFRGGLALLEHESLARFGGRFVDLAPNDQTAMLDLIAYPDDVEPGLERAAAFFTRLRDMTASGFFSSRMGVDDLRYTGNRGQATWDGCPAEALNHIGVSYDA